ncbi:hypothetical protein CAEBREN_19552 [Caenorhabditis brenneri]|uniref:Tyrosine-protein kinase n=1 Tax=Caenorhabditis brenneri TaxID=135651 RepID=G0N0F4_CAEBE|nr:hypothetical protein CAEBREN_19552 [Caenorhabditis brenneri]
MSLTESSSDENRIECCRQNTTNPPSDGEISDKGSDTEREIGKSDVNTNSISSSGTSSSGKENPEEDYIRTTLKNYAWYHGMMFGNIVQKLLKWNFSFLVRRVVFKGKRKCLCISFKVQKKIFHFSLNQNEEGWCCPRLPEKFPKLSPKRHEHIFQIIDAWSQAYPTLIPVPRRSMVLQHNSITLENRLGHGAFGEVFKAKFVPKEATQSIEVAVKRVLGDAKREQLQEFCHEASIMAVLHHENIVAFYGIASLEEPIMVVMEMVTGGDLQKYLQTTPNISKPQILYFALNIACGMRHISSRNVIHRDLAARNCLITKDLKVKISDFGLSIFGVEVIQKRLKKAPIRWLSPETLIKGLFNEKTDVWSYGVVLTELMTRCKHNPLHWLSIGEAAEYIKTNEWPHRIQEGTPMELMDIVDMCCDKKKSEERTKAMNTTLTRKKSLDGGKSKTATRKRLFLSFRRKNKGALALPSGMTTQNTNPSPPNNSTTPSPSTPTVVSSNTTSSGPPTTSPNGGKG